MRLAQWVLRSSSRFERRVVVMVDSKVIVGAVTKGRSCSIPINSILQRLAALCFAGGLVLHVVFVPTSHNPSDWPSRGGPETWPGALRWRAPFKTHKCPSCGVLASKHPLDAPRHLRGSSAVCKGLGTRHAFIDNDWVPDYMLTLGRIIAARSRRATLRSVFDALRPFADIDAHELC